MKNSLYARLFLPVNASRSLFLLVCLALTLCSIHVKAQYTTSAYTFSQSSGTYTPITGGTQAAVGAAWDDGIILSIPLGFNFVYLGVNYTTFQLNFNGYITLGGTMTNNYYCSPQIAANQANVIFAWGTDIVGLTAGSEIRYEMVGSPGNRTMVIQWTDVSHYLGTANSDKYNWQIRLNETSNSINVVYGTYSNVSTEGPSDPACL